MLKTCTACGTSYEVPEHYYNTYVRCPPCRREVQHALRDKKKAYLREYMSKHACYACGEADPVVLQLHHVDPSTKHRRNNKSYGSKGIAAIVQDNRSLNTLIAEIAKCIVLCANCHLRRHRSSGEGY